MNKALKAPFHPITISNKECGLNPTFLCEKWGLDLFRDSGVWSVEASLQGLAILHPYSDNSTILKMIISCSLGAVSNFNSADIQFVRKPH